MSMPQECIALTQAAFDRLPTYSTSLPTGTWPGKQWKAKYKGKDNWQMGEYYEEPSDPANMYIKWKKIVIREAGLKVDQIVDPDTWADRMSAFEERAAHV